MCGGWKLYSQRYVIDDGARISTRGYDDSQWLPASVPGTILASVRWSKWTKICMLKKLLFGEDPNQLCVILVQIRTKNLHSRTSSCHLRN